MQEGRRDKDYQKSRASGDLLLYFFGHNIISGLLFFFITLGVGIYDQQQEVYGLDGFQIFFYLFSSEFWVMVIQAIFILFVCSGLGRITAFIIIKWYHDYKNRSIKKWSELNRKINRLGVRWFLTTTITAVIYCVGVVSWLSMMIFNEDALLPLLVIYIFIKILVFFSVRWFVGSKL